MPILLAAAIVLLNLAFLRTAPLTLLIVVPLALVFLVTPREKAPNR